MTLIGRPDLESRQRERRTGVDDDLFGIQQERVNGSEF